MDYQSYDSSGVEVKANGELSRMRSHKGNTPTLPQTKCCPLCPAKFTRTTHLHRHLRSHTNERSYRCDLCSAEFTRSDLLTRHKKTCGDPAMQRSRRKSCQACAESKIKCDLEYPCSKCLSRSKTCEFVNDPAISRSKKLSQAERKSTSGSLGNTSHHSSSFEVPSLDIYPGVSPSPPNGFTTSSSSSSGHSSLYESSNSSPQTPPHDYGALDHQGIAGMDIAQILFPEDMFASQVPTAEEEAWWDGALGRSYICGGLPHDSTFLGIAGKACPSSSSTATGQSNVLPETELKHYLYLFFETFSVQFPIIHRHTWPQLHKDAHPLLVRAMQACGALFVRTRRASRFISETISSTRKAIMDEFIAVSPRQQDILILAVSLLQMIGLFHQDPELRASSNAWHDVLVMMISRSSVVERSRSWSIPDLDDLHALDRAWGEWALHEIVKRGLVLSYLHDCSRCIYFDMPPTLQAHEISLPCDDIIWHAPSSVEWFAAINAPSVYGGPGPQRLVGQSLRQTLDALADTRIANSLPSQNMFSMFVLIHGILCNMYSQLRCPDGARVIGPHLQFVLHNWYQLWSSSGGESSPSAVPADLDVPFVYDGLPFYWLAQVSLWETQSGNVSSMGGVASDRFHLMKERLHHIRFLLRTNMGARPDLFKELIVNRQKFAISDPTNSNYNGVLSFLSRF